MTDLCPHCGAALCKTCGWQAAMAAGECRACYAWRRRHGGEARPEHVIIRHAERVQQRIHEDGLVARTTAL